MNSNAFKISKTTSKGGKIIIPKESFGRMPGSIDMEDPQHL